MTESYFKYTTRSRLDKSINSLIGIIEGISIDGVVHKNEAVYLGRWITEHSELHDKHPYTELIPTLVSSLKDNKIDQEELQNLRWLCDQVRSKTYYDNVTVDIQILQSILAGIISDNLITETELMELSNWMEEREHLKRCWPYDEIESLIVSTLADKRIDAHEHKMLFEYFSDFSEIKPDIEAIKTSISTVSGICSISPRINFSGSTFCFTGEAKYPREELEIQVMDREGTVTRSISKKVNYLVIGSEGNPCWAYACYGRKIEQAINLRKQGHSLLLVHENDFHDAIADD